MPGDVDGVYKRWVPLPDVPRFLELENIAYRYGELSLTLEGGGRVLELWFGKVVGLRLTDEEDRGAMWRALLASDERRCSLYTVTESRFVDWLEKESHEGRYGEWRHVAVVTSDEVVDVIIESDSDTKVSWL